MPQLPVQTAPGFSLSSPSPVLIPAVIASTQARRPECRNQYHPSAGQQSRPAEPLSLDSVEDSPGTQPLTQTSEQP